MTISTTFTPKDRAHWHDWLIQKQDKEKEVWVVYFKPASGRTGIGYEDSVEEALCFGWIDSLIKKIDEESYARKFNPRRPGSHWSACNKKRAEKLIAEGKMTSAGLAVYDPNAAPYADSQGQRILRSRTSIPATARQRLQRNPAAWKFFRQLPPYRQRQYVGWILSAKKKETQERRWKEVLATLEQGKPLGLK
jgi:uncharacterized protein YdeI (YjbR/CyaY-like superfamily)